MCCPPYLVLMTGTSNPATDKVSRLCRLEPGLDLPSLRALEATRTSWKCGDTKGKMPIKAWAVSTNLGSRDRQYLVLVLRYWCLGRQWLEISQNWRYYIISHILDLCGILYHIPYLSKTLRYYIISYLYPCLWCCKYILRYIFFAAHLSAKRWPIIVWSVKSQRIGKFWFKNGSIVAQIHPVYTNFC